MGEKTHTVEVDLFRTDSGEIVERGNPEAMYVLYPAGAEIPFDKARELGLVKPAPKATPKATKSKSTESKKD
jgi:hypothetical protein